MDRAVTAGLCTVTIRRAVSLWWLATPTYRKL